MHEQSETIQRNGKFYNVYGKTTPQAGQDLPGEPAYETLDAAVAGAKKRSADYGHGTTRYKVTSPTGDTYMVTGPEGATDEQVLQQVKAYKPEATQAPAAPAAPAPAAAPKAAAPVQPPPVSGGDSTSGFIGGNINKGIAGLAGLPVDTIRNALNLGIAGVGAATRTTPSLIEPGPGSSQWFENLLRRGNMIGPSAEPESVGGRYAAAGLQMLPGAAIGRPTLGQLPRAVGTAATSGLGGELAADIGGEEYRSVGAMAPGYGPGKRLAAPPTTSERATTGRQAERFGKAKEIGIPVPPREMAPDKPQQKIQDRINQELGQPLGTEIVPETLHTYNGRYWGDYEAVIKLPALKGGVTPTPRFQQEIQAIGNEIERARESLPETFKGMRPVIKLLGEYGYAQVPGGAGQGITIPPRAQPIPPDVAIRAIKKLRADATTNFQSDNPQKVELAQTQRRLATSLEDLIEENLAKTGDQALMQTFKQARTAIAKSHDVEASLNPVTRKVDPARLSALMTEGRPLSGGLKDIAQVSGEFPGAVKSPSTPSDDYFTKRVTPMAVMHPEAMTAHWLTRMWDPLTTSRPYQSAMVDPRNKLSPEQERVMRYIFSAMAANRGQDQGEIPAPPR